MHSPVLVCSSAGDPPTSTRVAGTSHWMRTQGIGVATGTVNGHPAMRNWSLSVVTGCPPTSTRTLVGTTVAGMPCVQSVRLAACARGPGTMSVTRVQVIVRATPLMATVGPVITIDAPLPFEIVSATSLMEIIAPDIVLMITPPVGPAMSLSSSVVCPCVCMITTGTPGGVALTIAGTSAREPYQQPLQIG